MKRKREKGRERERERERERARERESTVSLGLLGKSIKLIHRTCTSHEGTGHPLKEVLKAQARK